MPKQLLINLPVSDPAASRTFFIALGLPLNQQLSDDQATCFNLEDNIVIALLPADHFKEIIGAQSMADAATNETLLAIGLDSDGAVTELLDKAVAAGGQELHDRVDMPEICAGTFTDLDGHQWNVFHMRHIDQ